MRVWWQFEIGHLKCPGEGLRPLAARWPGSTRLNLSAHHGRDSRCCTLGSFMLPHPNHCPVKAAKRLRVPGVSLAIAFDLGTPPVGVRLGPCPVTRTTVPEAAIHEYKDSCAGEGDVWSASYTRHGPISPVPQPLTVQLSAKEQLAAGIASTGPSHAIAYGGPAGFGIRVHASMLRYFCS